MTCVPVAPGANLPKGNSRLRGKSQKKEAQRMAELACSIRLSRWGRGEDEGEGFVLCTEQFPRNYPSPSPSPLARERRPYPQLCAISCRSRGDHQRTPRRRGNRIRFRLSWRAKEGQDARASTSLGVSREFHRILFPQGPIATRARRLSEHRHDQ